jgi:hypothetical protein
LPADVDAKKVNKKTKANVHVNAKAAANFFGFCSLVFDLTFEL